MFEAFTFVFTLWLFAPASHAQLARPGELPRIDAATRAAIVDSITSAIDSIYVLEQPAKRIVAGLRKYLTNGDYDDLTDPAEFAQRLYRDAQAINHDGHFRIAAMPPLDPAVAEAQQDEDEGGQEEGHRAHERCQPPCDAREPHEQAPSWPPRGRVVEGPESGDEGEGVDHGVLPQADQGEAQWVDPED